MYTTHGHHIPGTPLDSIPSIVSKCGGAMTCALCAKETASKLIQMVTGNANNSVTETMAQYAEHDVAHTRTLIDHPPVTHSEDTLFKVREALSKAGLDADQATNVISEVFNVGVVFREPIYDREDGNMVAHARRELEMIGEEPATIEWYISVIRAFAAFGHSGGSAAETIPVLHILLQQKNLTPLTDNPDEWMDQSEVSGMPLWQNIRRSEAFSEDGGKTYWLLNTSTAVTYNSEPHQKDATESAPVSG